VATWNRNSSGSFQKDSSIVQIFHGADAFLLEDELNESQWIKVDSLAALNREKFTNGFLDTYTINDGVTINSFFIENSVDSTVPLNLLVDGYNLTIGRITSTTNDGRMVVYVNAPPSSGTRTDLVILEAWFEVMSNTDTLKKFGSVDPLTPNITNSMFDSRLSKETTRRVQFRWRTRAIDGGSVSALTSTKANLYNGTLSTVNYTQKGDIYVAETGAQYATVNGANSFKTNGTVYAIPLFTVSRSSGTTMITASKVTDVSPKARIKDNQVRNEIINTVYNKVNTELIDTKVKNTLLKSENIKLTDANNNYDSTTVAGAMDEVETKINNSDVPDLIRQSNQSGFVKNGALNFYNMYNNIFHMSESVVYVNGNRVYIPSDFEVAVPTHSNFGAREDFVFLEAFWTQKNPGDPVYKYNNVGNTVLRTATTYENVFEWRIRAVANVDFNRYPEGFDDGNGDINKLNRYRWNFAIAPQGSKSQPIDLTSTVSSFSGDYYRICFNGQWFICCW
jgi:hypothetical protein